MAYRTQSDVERDKRCERSRKRSFWTGAFRLLYLLTPLCTDQYQYVINGEILEYYDVYVFGFRIISTASYLKAGIRQLPKYCKPRDWR